MNLPLHRLVKETGRTDNDRDSQAWLIFISIRITLSESYSSRKPLLGFLLIFVNTLPIPNKQISVNTGIVKTGYTN